MSTASSRNGEFRDINGTVVSSGIWTNGKHGASLLKVERSFSASAKVILRCLISTFASRGLAEGNVGRSSSPKMFL